MILLVDNYDSFTFNLVHSLERGGVEVVVRRNDAFEPTEVAASAPEAIVLGPGPGGPQEAGRCLELLAAIPPELPVLGVCLGHQLLVVHHGGRLELDPEPVHGRATEVFHRGRGPFEGLPNPMPAGRYHSIRAGELPPSLELEGWTREGDVMAVRHESAPHHGVQFHPDSILTPDGDRLVAGFLRLAAACRRASAAR